MKHPATLVLSAVLVAAACGGSASSAASGPATNVAVSMSDKAITLASASASAGKVTFAVKNVGTVVHHIVAIKTNLDEAKLPTDTKDPGKVDERGRVGATGQLKEGESKDLTLDLASGKYVLVCNEPAHYLVGMHAAFTVK